MLFGAIAFSGVVLPFFPGILNSISPDGPLWLELGLIHFAFGCARGVITSTNNSIMSEFFAANSGVAFAATMATTSIVGGIAYPAAYHWNPRRTSLICDGAIIAGYVCYLAAQGIHDREV